MKSNDDDDDDDVEATEEEEERMQKLVGDLDGHSLGVCSGKMPSHRHKAYHGSPTRRMILKQRIHFGFLSFVFILHTNHSQYKVKTPANPEVEVF